MTKFTGLQGSTLRTVLSASETFNRVERDHPTESENSDSAKGPLETKDPKAGLGSRSELAVVSRNEQWQREQRYNRRESGSQCKTKGGRERYGSEGDLLQEVYNYQ